MGVPIFVTATLNKEPARTTPVFALQGGKEKTAASLIVLQTIVLVMETAKQSKATTCAYAIQDLRDRTV